jgi:hypothetical protein
LTVEPTVEVTPEIQPIITPNQNEGLISKIEGELMKVSQQNSIWTINLMEQPENIEVYINGEPQVKPHYSYRSTSWRVSDNLRT